MERIHVALTPRDPAPADVAVVVDCIRATTTIAYALAAGYRQVVCVAEVDEARREAEALGSEAVLGGERLGVRIEGFHLGNSPAEYERPLAETLVLTTTNGTRAILQAAAEAEHVLLGSLACLDRVSRVALELGRGGELAVRCAGVGGEFALDDVYVAGRLVQRAVDGANGAFLTDGARIARAVAQAYAAPLAALLDSQSARELDGTGLESDIARCARESTLDVAPRVVEVAPGRVVVMA
jgi:2-phosphosulfolactate phosphatase